MFDLTATLFPDQAPTRLRAGPMAPLQQSAVYARAVQMVGGKTRYVALPGTGAWIVQRKMPLFGQVGVISRGPTDLTQASAMRLRELSDSRHLIVNAEDEIGADALEDAGFWRIARPRHIAELELCASPEVMARRLSQKFRNRLRFAQRQNLQIKRTVLPANPRHWLFEADARNAKLKGYQPFPAVLVAAVAAAKPGAAQMFVARTLEGPVAALLFLRHVKMATYQIGWSNEAGRKASAGNLLMWRAMVDLQSMGVDRLDLGAADPATAPGLTHFKRGTGAAIRVLGGTWMTSAALPNRRANPFRKDAMDRLRHIATTAVERQKPM